MSDPILEVPFIGGIDESVRDEILEPGKSFVVLENGRYDKIGGYSKRPGFAALARTRLTGSDRSSALRLFTNGDQICTIDATPELDVYSTSLGRSVVRGRVPEASVRLREVPSSNLYAPPPQPAPLSQATLWDTVVVSGGAGGVYAALAYLTTDTAGTTFANVTLLDADNGAVVLSPTNLEAASLVTLATYSTFVLCFLVSSANLKLYKLDVTSAASIAAGWSLVSALATDVGTNSMIQAVRLPSGGGCAVAYKNNSGGASPISIRSATQAGSLASTTIAATSADLNIVSLSEGGTVLWVAWNQTTTTRAASLNETTLAIVAAAANVLTAGVPTSIFVSPRASGAAAVHTSTGAATYMVAIQNSAGAAATAGSPATLGGVRLISRPFLNGSRLYAHVASILTTEMVLCDVTPDTTSGSNLVTYLRPVAAAIQRELFSISGLRTSLIPNTTKYLHGFSQKRSGTTVGAALAEYDFASPYRWRPAVLNGSTYLSGGVLSVFDGTRVSEAAFLVRPYTGGISFNTAVAGNVTLATGRRYVLTFSEVDADGNKHISGVSDPSLSTGAVASKKITFDVVPIVITSRGFTTSAIASSTQTSSLVIEVWGTLDGGSTYYRVGSVANNPNVLGISFTDDTPDFMLASQPLLYGTGSLPGTNNSSQDHRAAPGLAHVVSYNGMIVGANGPTVYYSSQTIDGEGVWFSPVFTLAGDEEVTGLAVQDGAVIIFSRRTAWVTSGGPPSDNGQQGGLATPKRLAIEFGCTNANSIVTTDLGTFRQTDRGIELLTRGLTTSTIGQPIQDTLAAYPVVSAAVLDTINSLVRFSLASSQTSGVVGSAGRDVVYDMILQTWVSVDVKRGTLLGDSSQDAAMVYAAGAWRYAWLATNGTVYYERLPSDLTKCLDGSSWIPKRAMTAWLHVAGMQGEQFIDQLLFLAQRVTNHDLLVSFAFDYEESFTEVESFSAAMIGALGKEWLVRGMTRTQSTAIRILIEDLEPSSGSIGSGEGGTWISYTLNGTAHQGPRRSPAAARRGT